MDLPEMSKLQEVAADLEKYEVMWCQLEEFKTGMLQ
jgi:hypothetical protein